MSSLSAAQADGYYIPPEYIDSGKYKSKSLNQFNGSKGHNQYLQRSVVRFELPYDGFCENPNCKAHISKGTRFNAHKAHVDDYHTTKIWEFTMKCRACASQMFAIRTNPRGRCFDYVSGIHRQVEEFDTVNAGTLGMIDTDRGNGIEHASHASLNRALDERISGVDEGKDDPLKKLEKRIVGERKAVTDRDAMELLLNHNKITMRDDASSNSTLRANYRKVRKAKKRRLCDAEIAGLGKGIELHDSTPEERILSKRVFFQGNVQNKRSRDDEKKKFATIRADSIFSNCQESKKNRLGSRGNTRHTKGPPSHNSRISQKMDKAKNEGSSSKADISVNSSERNGKCESTLLALADYDSD